MKRQMTIKPCDDAAVLASFHRDVQEAHHQWYPELFKPFDHAVMTCMIKQQVASAAHFFYVAYLDASPCGFVHLEDSHRDENAIMYERHFMECAAIAVLPDAQKLGVGRFMLHAAEHLAKEKGYKGISLNFWSANQVQSFYEDAGYQIFRQCAFKGL